MSTSRIACALVVWGGLLGFGAAAPGMDPEIASDRVWARHFWYWYDTGEVSAGAINLKLLVGDVAIDDPLTPSLVLFEELVQNSIDSEYSVTPAALDDPLASDIIRFHSLTGWLAAPTDSPLATGLVEMAGEGEVVTSSNGAYAGIKSNSPPGGNVAPGVDENGNNVPDMYDDFWQELNDAVEASKLEYLLNPDKEHFYIEDTRATDGYLPFDSTPAKAGFDCDDYAKAMECYLEHTLGAEHPGMVVDFLLVQWSKPLEGTHEHAMVYIKYEGVTYVVDPQYGAIRGPYVDFQGVWEGVGAILIDEYEVELPVNLLVIESVYNRADSVVPPYYYTDPNIMTQFEAALEEQGVTDVTPYLPDNYTPPPSADLPP